MRGVGLSVLRGERRNGERDGEDIALRSVVFCMRRFRQLVARLIRWGVSDWRRGRFGQSD